MITVGKIMKSNPINKKVQAQYDKLWNNEWRNLLQVGPGVQTRQRILMRFMKKYLSNGSVIDIGCGDGKFLADLNRKYGKDLTYCAGDISQSALNLVGKHHFIDDTILMDITNIGTLPESKYTGVIASEVLEHIDDWKSALSNITNLVEPGGYIFITVPALMKHMSIHDQFAHHFRRFEIGEIENDLEQINYIVLESLCWGWPIYSLYYSLFLKRMNPKTLMSENKSPFIRIASTILYYLFFIDDLFPSSRGRRLFIVAQKNR